MWIRRRREREKAWAAEHARFEALVSERFADRLARLGFEPNLGGLPMPVFDRYAVLFEASTRDAEIESHETWLCYWPRSARAEVSGTWANAGFRASASSEAEAFSVFDQGISRIELDPDGRDDVVVDVHQITVDGEVFVVSTPVTQVNVRWFEWLSGPNPGYGFASGLNGGEWRPELIEESARNFLSQIDPRTGYVGDD